MPEVELRLRGARVTEEGAEEDLRSLLAWLTEDEGTGSRIRGRITGDQPLPPGHMGTGAFDLVQLAVGSGLSMASLVFTILQWQAARRRPPEVSVRCGPYEIRLTGSEATDPETLGRIVAALGGDDDGSS
ncbi:hypothetical protein [Streptomyces sp. NPDC089799]|uniref:effector-associated constant component EACC1 n=1 Tax=Streptomyces sp. NPDC089799 TaxID=3155066 RepID=UPI00343AB24B